MAKIKEPKLVGVNKHNKISEPKREETLNRYLNWKYYNKSRNNKYISRIKKALYDLPEIQEAITTKEELEDAAEAVTRVQLGRGYGVEYFDVRDLPEFTWNNQSTLCLVEDRGQAPQKDVLLYSLDSELGEAIEDYEEYKEIISDDRTRVRNLLNKYDDWSELFAKYPIFRNLWEEDLDELYPSMGNAAWRKKKADRLVGVELPKAGLTGADKKAQEIINQLNAAIDKVDLEKVHLVKKAEEDHWGEDEATIFNRAVVMSTPEFEKAMGLANQIVENLKSNPSFTRSTDLAAKYASVIPTFNYVKVTFGYDSLERRIEVPTYVGLKESDNSSQRIPYRLGTNLTNIPADLKVGSFQGCIDFTIAAMRVEEIARAIMQAFNYDAQRIFTNAETVSLKDAVRANEKAVAIYNKLREEGFPKWRVFEDIKYDWE